MLRKIRIILASIFFTGVTLLFLDFTGTLHAWLGWMAKIQLLPAALALNVMIVAIHPNRVWSVPVKSRNNRVIPMKKMDARIIRIFLSISLSGY